MVPTFLTLCDLEIHSMTTRLEDQTNLWSSNDMHQRQANGQLFASECAFILHTDQTVLTLV